MKNGIIVIFAALLGGGIAYAIPMSLLEVILATSGLSETIPAFQPPLGDTARFLFVGGGMIVGAGIALIACLRGSGEGQRGEQKEMKMNSILSRLTSFSKGKRTDEAPVDSPVGARLRNRVERGMEPPVLRRSDAHPDAPPRPPLFAHRDLGDEPLIPSTPVTSVEEAEHTVQADTENPVVSFPAAAPFHGCIRDVNPHDDGIYQEEVQAEAPSATVIPFVEPAEAHIPADRTESLSMPRAPEPLPWELIEREMNRIMNEPRPATCKAPSALEDFLDEPEEEVFAPAARRFDAPDHVVPSHNAEETEGETALTHEVAEAQAEIAEYIASGTGAQAESASVPHEVSDDADMSIGQLVDRLEQGMRRKRAGSDGDGGSAIRESADSTSGAVRSFDPPQNEAESVPPLAPPNLSLVHERRVSGQWMGEDDPAMNPAQDDDLQRALAALRVATARAG